MSQISSVLKNYDWDSNFLKNYFNSLEIDKESEMDNLGGVNFQQNHDISPQILIKIRIWKIKNV